MLELVSSPGGEISSSAPTHAGFIKFCTGELSEAIRARQHSLPTGEFDSIITPANLTVSIEDPLMKSVYLMIDTIASLLITELPDGLRDSAIKILENMMTSDSEYTLFS
jgi:hypothetical protein